MPSTRTRTHRSSLPGLGLGDSTAALRGLAAAGAKVADEETGKALLRRLGIATPAGRVVTSAQGAVEAAAELAAPVGLKVAAADLPHKSDVGGVAGPLHSAADVGRAATTMMATLDRPLLVEVWEPGGVDCFVGLSLRGPLGPIVTVGLGGIWVEVLRDVSHRAAPVSLEEAAEALEALQGYPVLSGARGQPATDVFALADTIAAISRLALVPEICELVAEIEVNPLRARSGAPPLALDCTIVLASRVESVDDRGLVAEAAR